MSKLHKHNHIPRQHLTGERDYVPFKARTPGEKARRHGRLPGHVLAEQEMRGLAALDTLLERAPDDASRRYLAHFGAIALVNTDWNLRIRNGSTMYKPVDLAMLAIGEDDQRPTAAGVYEHAAVMLGGVLRMSAGRVIAYEKQWRNISHHKLALGRHAGNLAQMLAAVEVADEVRELSPHQTQVYVRERSLDVSHAARTAGEDIGADPTIAQLVDPYSPLVGFIHRTAPDGVIDVMQTALYKYEMPR